MAVTTITPVQLALNTESADLPDASLTAVATAVDGFSIAAPVGGFRQSLVIRLNNSGAGTNTVTFTAGTKPAAMHADLGNLTVSLAAADVRMISVDESRFAQSDGTIDGVTQTDAEILMAAYLLPRNL
ncbi:MAG: hypothetical protein ACYTKD_31440 [Planctomycetota bacterium]|jgi:hypothetical protein